MSDVVIAGRGHCCDPFAVLKQEIDMAITIAMNARNIAEEALASTGAGASDNNPLALADTPSPGTAMEWSRSDHVHPNTGLLEPDDVIAGDNIDITDNGDGTVTISLKADQVRVGNTVLTGNVTITGNITQNGASYETHAEKVYTTNDYIITRDGATGALGSGDYSGFQVKLYDGVNDGRLVIDNTGTARVGDVGDEQPLMTRDESADLTNDNLIKWDGTNQKAVDAGKKVSDFGIPNTVVSNGITTGSLTLGSNNYNLVSLITPTAGTYLLQINGKIQCSSLSGTRLLIGYNINTTSSANEWIDARNPINQDWCFTTTKILTLSAGDIVRVCGTQDSISSAAIRGIFASLIRLA